MIGSPHFLCLITSDREIENVDEMTRDIWHHFDGIAAVVHRQGGDGSVVNLLRSRQGPRGFVKVIDWKAHHGHSMNEWLIDSRIPAMACCWIRDSSERFNSSFTADHMRPLAEQLLDRGIWNVAQHSKLLMFRRWYGQQFVNGLHWGLIGARGGAIPIEHVSGYTLDRSCAYSVRHEKRSPTHRYRHEVLYLLDYGLNGNHLALFHPDASDLDKAYQRLAAFTAYLAERGIHGVDQFTDWLKGEYPKGLPSKVRDWVNAERPFRNLLRFSVLGHAHEAILMDEDTWRLS